MFLSVYADFPVIVSKYLLNIFFGIDILATNGIIRYYPLVSVFVESAASNTEYIRDFSICKECVVV